MEIPVLI